MSPNLSILCSHFDGFLSTHSEPSSVVDENTFVPVGCTVGNSVIGLSVSGLSVTGLSVSGLSVIGLSVPGFPPERNTQMQVNDKKIWTS